MNPWRLDQQSSNGGRPSRQSFFVRFAGTFDTRCRCAMSKSSWRSAAWKPITRRYGAGYSAMVPNLSSGSGVTSSPPTSPGASTRLRGCKPKPRKFYNAFDISLLIRIQTSIPPEILESVRYRNGAMLLVIGVPNCSGCIDAQFNQPIRFSSFRVPHWPRTSSGLPAGPDLRIRLRSNRRSVMNRLRAW
jgi:hypothetical protein